MNGEHEPIPFTRSREHKAVKVEAREARGAELVHYEEILKRDAYLDDCITKELAKPREEWNADQLQKWFWHKHVLGELTRELDELVLESFKPAADLDSRWSAFLLKCEELPIPANENEPV